jgi:hypothetical protein
MQVAVCPVTPGNYRYSPVNPTHSFLTLSSRFIKHSTTQGHTVTSAHTMSHRNWIVSQPSHIYNDGFWAKTLEKGDGRHRLSRFRFAVYSVVSTATEQGTQHTVNGGSWAYSLGSETLELTSLPSNSAVPQTDCDPPSVYCERPTYWVLELFVALTYEYR